MMTANYLKVRVPKMIYKSNTPQVMGKVNISTYIIYFFSITLTDLNNIQNISMISIKLLYFNDINNLVIFKP
jgi:hypothetical protein